MFGDAGEDKVELWGRMSRQSTAGVQGVAPTRVAPQQVAALLCHQCLLTGKVQTALGRGWRLPPGVRQSLLAGGCAGQKEGPGVPGCGRCSCCSP